jgi:hypothetical protein
MRLHPTWEPLKLKMMQAAAILLTGLMMVSAVHARLGETRKECIARYGEPVSETESFATFQNSEFTMFIRFAEGKAAYIYFGKPPPKGGKLSDHDVASLMEANGGGRKWKVKPSSSNDRAWITEDGEWYALYDDAKGALTIATKSFLLQMSVPGKAK